ncbi:MAG TPA: hypothetical protein PKD09_07550 [Aggregatilinea sp.]|jgi:hypothetical protein|uniref:hypothetical protein n=1 Tax=Aggregatilinea sp. TaxID=2806333 RepID=UPI002B8CE0BB|nr:hypothetical protein [Aggregatilinea sp.]HML21484.1 hypothetical protein [Aggregatilinea sp.]
MRKLTFLLMAVLIVAFALPGGAAHANAFSTPCGDQQDPGTGVCRPTYMGGEAVTLKVGVPFAWLRAQPQAPQVIATVWPNAAATMQIAPGSQGHFDGFQWWWFVTLAPSGQPYVAGWVEQASLVVASVAPNDPAVPGYWQLPISGRVKAGIPFVWMRAAPSSQAAPVYTIPPLGPFVVVSGPSFDGYQWWWMVMYPGPYGHGYGWVEQASIQPLS